MDGEKLGCDELMVRSGAVMSLDGEKWEEL